MKTSNPQIVNLRNEIEANHKEVNALFAKHDEDLVNDEKAQMSAEDVRRVKDLNKETEAKEEKLAELLELEGIRSRNSERGKPGAAVNALPHPSGDGTGREARKPITLGEAVVSDDAFAQFMQDLSTRKIPEKGKIDGPVVAMAGALMATLFTGASSTSAGALVVNDRKPIVDPGTFMRPLTLKDIITIGRTDSDTVEFVRQTGFTNNAAPVAEASATSGVSGTKPESGGTLAVATANVKTIAHWIPATRRALADAGQLQTLINAMLLYGLEEELEDQMVTGDGAGENFTGLLNISGTTAQAFDTNIATTTRKARTKVRTTGRAVPTAYVMHPNDWEDFDLLQDNEKRYYYGGPSVMGMPRLWGLPVVECEAMTEGTCMVAPWRMAVLWDREQSSITASNSHADFFVRNLIAVLAELRAAFDVIRPAAFVEIDLTA